MVQKLNKTMLAIAAIALATLTTSCDKNESIDRDSLYFSTSYNAADNYFKPKKLNVYCRLQGIDGNWFYKESVDNSTEKNGDVIDYLQDNTERYYFLDQSSVKKYVDLKNATMKEVYVEPNDIINPFKDYADYFGDTLLKTRHNSGSELAGTNLCVLPITGIDVTCDKDFDDKHPAGSSLNDIMYYMGFRNLYKYLNEKDENGVPIHKGKSLYDFEIIDFGTDYFYDVTLSDIPEHPLIMANEFYSLKFNHLPTEHGKYEFTVKFSFGSDPLSGETVDIAPAKVSIDF